MYSSCYTPGLLGAILYAQMMTVDDSNDQAAAKGTTPDKGQ
jgi:hypothetical protein